MPKAKRRKRSNGQGTIWKDKSSYRWAIKSLNLEGRADTQAEAELALQKVLVDRSRGLLAPTNHITLAEYAERWLQRQHNVKARTAVKYRRELGYILQYLGDMRLQQIEPYHVKDAVAALIKLKVRHGRTLHRTTVKKSVGHLRAVFREAVSDRLIHANPMDSLSRIDAGKASAAAKVKALNFEQAARFHSIGTALFEAGMCRLWPALFLGISMGLRRGEIMGLRWSDLNLEKRTLRIRQTRVLDVDGFTTSDPKTDNSKRELRIPKGVLPVLQQHTQLQTAERKASLDCWRNDDIVFATALGDWTHPDNLNRALRALLKWADPATLNSGSGKHSVWQSVSRESRDLLQAVILSGERLPKITPHDLRHTYATLALRSGIPVEIVSKTLGHADIVITLSLYRHVLEDELRSTEIDLFPTPPQRPEVPHSYLN